MTIKEFFHEIFCPIMFFDGKSLIFVQNTVLAGSQHMKLDVDKKISLFAEKIKDKVFNMATIVGGPASDSTQASKSMYNKAYQDFNEELIYHSWIGHALSVGTAGFCISINDEDVVLKIYDGWKKYRELIESDFSLPDKGLTSFNSVWLCKSDSLLNKVSSNNQTAFTFDEYMHTDKGKKGFKPIFWAQVLFAISRISKKSMIYSYIYRLDKVNTTIGIIPIQLNKFRNLQELYIKFFGRPAYINDMVQIEQVYGSIYNRFGDVCTKGSIGISQLEPNINSIKNIEDLNFKTFTIWIMELLSEEKGKDIITLADEFSNYLIALKKAGSKKHKSTNTSIDHYINDILTETHNVKQFLGRLADLTSEDTNSGPIAEKLLDKFLDSSKDILEKFLFITRIKYNSAKNTTKKTKS
jgi:hypothetical protein